MRVRSGLLLESRVVVKIIGTVCGASAVPRQQCMQQYIPPIPPKPLQNCAPSWDLSVMISSVAPSWEKIVYVKSPRVLSSRKIKQDYSMFRKNRCPGTYQRFYNCLPATPREEVFLSTPILLQSVKDEEYSKWLRRFVITVCVFLNTL